MKKSLLLTLILFFSLLCTVAYPKEIKTKIILLIAEQNIQGPQRAWWASEIDLSTTEATLAQLSEEIK